MRLPVFLVPLTAVTALADVSVPRVFIQRDRAVPIRGKAEAGEKATVCFGGQKREATAGVAEPEAARFAFSRIAGANLMNTEGLPAGTFRTK